MPQTLMISTQLRAHLVDAGESLYGIAKAAGVPRSCLAAFVAGKRSVTVDTVDRIGAVLRLQLVQTGRRRLK